MISGKAPTVRILTLGCAKNTVDTEVMTGLLADDGCRIVTGGRADVVIVNTCGFIRDAKEESIGEILELGKAKARGRVGRLVVAGCMATRYREDLPRLLPEVDLFIGPGDLPELPGLIRKLFAGKAPLTHIVETAIGDRVYRRRAAAEGSASAFLKILEGCDNRCSYCTIPMIRGPLKSRSVKAILEEARLLVRRGAREINLIGQDITSYGADRGEKGALAPLVREICALRGVRWVRLLYLYPGRIDDSLIDLLAAEKKICRYLDIPVQHVDAGILERMGRRYSPEDVRELVARLRDRLPGIFLRTSVIVGFPGETSKAFDRLLRFVHDTRWDYLGVFPYSREEGTTAYSMRPRVPEAVRRERARRVQDIQADILAAKNAARVGEVAEVLVEKTFARGRAQGRHRGQAPEVDGSVRLVGYAGPAGRIVRARITGAREWDLFAKPVDSGATPGILT
jgi:ribosomal protein S12 methylthiotransferase